MSTDIIDRLNTYCERNRASDAELARLTRQTIAEFDAEAKVLAPEAMQKLVAFWNEQQGGWHDARADPPPLRQFVLLLDSWQAPMWPFSQRHTFYLGWLDQNENDDGEPIEAPWYWAEGIAEVLRGVTHWHSLPSVPEEAT